MNDNHPHSAPDEPHVPHDHDTSDPHTGTHTGANKAFFSGEFAIAISAATALIVALAVVTPDLIEDTSPDPIDWSALVVILGLLALLIRHTNRRP